MWDDDSREPSDVEGPSLEKIKHWFRDWYGRLPETELVGNADLIRKITAVEEILSKKWEEPICS
jgi:hypothetical protein